MIWSSYTPVGVTQYFQFQFIHKNMTEVCMNLYVKEINHPHHHHHQHHYYYDATLCTSHSDIQQIYTTANTHIDNLFEWFYANRLSLNANKTGLNIHIDNISLTRIGNDCEERAIKFLGMFIDEHLTWKSHISHVNAKVSRSLFVVNQAKNIFPKSCLRTLYFSLIHPHFSYGVLAWGSASLTKLKSSIMLQNRAIRNINRAKHRAHTEYLFKSSQILKLTDL